MGYLLRNANVVNGNGIRRVDILIEGDRISALRELSMVTPESGAAVIDCSSYLATPGFVNAHIHPNQLLNRGFLEGLATDELLAGMHGRHDSKTDDDRYWASLLSIAEGLRSGTTFFAAFVSDAGKIGDALRDAGVRGTLTVAPKDQWVGHGTAEIRDTERILRRLYEHAQTRPSSRVSASIGAVSEKGASSQLLRGIARLAADTGVRVFMHVAEGRTAVEVSRRLHQATPVEFLDEIGFLGAHVCLVHATRVTSAEIDRIARSKTSVCHCPISNAKTAAGVLPLRSLVDAGVAVALGTDAASTGNTNNLLVEGYFCGLLHRAVAETSTSPTAREVFEMLTVSGAAAVGLSDAIGKLEEGYKADIVLWDLGQSAFLPNTFDPLTALVFAGSEMRASRVFIDGNLVFDGEPTTFNVKEAISRVAAYSAKVHSYPPCLALHR
jgi:5-methylthioadenosine/S-adenosylhomocysteine deaminase